MLIMLWVIECFRVTSSFANETSKMESDRRSRRSSSTKIDENLVKVKNLLDSDSRLNEWMIFEYLYLPKIIVHKIMTENLGMQKLAP